MTRDAFYKAQELKEKLEAVHLMQSIIGNGTLAEDEDYYKGHNDHVRNDGMIICHMCKSGDIYKKNVVLDKIDHTHDSVEGDYHLSDFIYGKDVPLDLVRALEHCLWEYEQKIDKEFLELDGNYMEDDE